MENNNRTYKSGRIDNISFINPMKRTKEELKKELAKKRARDAELVVCKFKNLESEGRPLSFSYYRYKDQPIEKYHFEDGETYQIPRGIRNHVKSLYTPLYEYIKGPEGTSIQGGITHDAYQLRGMPTMKVEKKRHRFQFLDMDYMEDDDFIQNNIQQVTYVSNNLKV
jgi:hypothetical protein